MAKYLYGYHEERGFADLYVTDVNGNTVWEVHYPSFYESNGDMLEETTIFEDGFMESADDIEGLESYLKSISVINKGDELVDRDEDMYDYDADDSGWNYSYKKAFDAEYAAGGTIEAKIKKRLKNAFELPIQIAVYVPSTRDKDIIITKREMEARVEDVQRFLANAFGGFSAVKVEGGFESSDKGLIQEDAVRVVAFASKENENGIPFEQSFESLMNQVKNWCSKWSQQSIGVEFENDLFYVDSETKFGKGGEVDLAPYKDIQKLNMLYKSGSKWYAWGSKYNVETKGEGYTKKEALQDLDNHLSYVSEDDEFADGGEVPSKREMLDYLKMYFKYYSELRTIAVEEDGILTKRMLPTLDNEQIEMAYEDAKYELDEILKYENYADGGDIAESNLQMLRSNVKAIKHHAEELEGELNDDTEVEAWVVAKGERAETDLSDITHYLDGKEFSLGGMTAGRYYRDNSGEEFKFIGKVDSGQNKGRFLFSDGKKSVYKDLEDFEGGKPKETKLFGFFEDGGEVAKKGQVKIGDSIYKVFYNDWDGEEFSVPFYANSEKEAISKFKNKYPHIEYTNIGHARKINTSTNYDIFEEMREYADGGMMSTGVKIKVRDIEDDSIKNYSLKELLLRINEDNVDEENDYNESDWIEGFNETLEGEFYSLNDKNGKPLNKFSDGGMMAKGGSIKSLEKRVAEVNELIKRGNELGIEVVDEGNTWQAPMKYKPLKYTNGVLYVSYEQLDLYKYNREYVQDWEKKSYKIGKYESGYGYRGEAGAAQREALTEIARMYRKPLKSYDTYGYFEDGGEVNKVNPEEIKVKIEQILDKVVPSFYKGVSIRKNIFDTGNNIRIFIAASDYKINGVSGQFPQVVSLSLDLSDMDLHPQVYGGNGGQRIDREKDMNDPNEKFFAFSTIKIPFRTPQPNEKAVLYAIRRFAENYKKTLAENREVLLYQDIVDYDKLLAGSQYADGGMMADGGEVRKFDPSYKLTYYEDNDLEKAKSDIIKDSMEHIKYVAEYFGMDKADNLHLLLTRVKNANNPEELGILLNKISQWFYDNTDIETDMGSSKMERNRRMMADGGMMAKGGELMKHKHNEHITIELIEPTNKGWKVKQIETHSVGGRKLSTPKEKVAYFSKEELTDLFEPTMAKGGEVIDKLWQGYAEAILFTEIDLDTDEPLDSNYSISDFDSKTVKDSKEMLRKFYNDNKDAIIKSGLDLSIVGNDVWYTRSGQGAGFFDHSLEDDTEKKLIAGAKALGEYPSVETYDGKISVRGGRVFKKGGTFAAGVKAIEKRLVGTKVNPKFQKEYGKTYDKQEANEAATKIKGKMRAMELAKKYKKKK